MPSLDLVAISKYHLLCLQCFDTVG